MRHWAAGIALFCAGCANAPVACFLDAVSPSHAKPNIDHTFEDGIAPPSAAPLATLPADGRLLSPQIGPPAAVINPPAPVPIGPPTSPSGPGIVDPLKLPNT